MTHTCTKYGIRCRWYTLFFQKYTESILFCDANKVSFIGNKKVSLAMFLATFRSSFFSPEHPKVIKYFGCIMWMLIPRLYQDLCFRALRFLGIT